MPPPAHDPVRIARDAEAQARIGQFDAARALLDALRRGGHDGLPQAVLAEAEWQFRSGHNAEAQPLAVLALDGFLHERNAVEALRTRELLARIAVRDGEENAAAEQFDRLRSAWAQLQRSAACDDDTAGRGQARCLLALVTLCRRRERFDEGLRLGRKLLPLARRFNHERVLVNSLNALGGIHFELAARQHPLSHEGHHLTALTPVDLPTIRHHCEQAMTFLAEAAVIASAEGDDYLTAMLGSNLAQLQVLLGRPLEALPAMHAFLARNRKGGNRYMECDSLMAIGWAQWAAGDLAAAKGTLLAALELNRSGSTLDQRGSIHYDLSRVYEGLDEAHAALQHYREYSRLRLASLRKAAGAGRGGAAPIAPAPEPRLLEPFYLKRAERFMTANLHRHVTVDEMAAHVGVSTRTLFVAFRKYRGDSPLAGFRRRRLEAAHDELQAANATTVTITQVAHRWGFVDGGHFAREYRRAFGRTPSQTLRREA